MPLVELVLRSITRTRWPRVASSRTTWDPRKPLAPMTSCVPPSGPLSRPAIRLPSDRFDLGNDDIDWRVRLNHRAIGIDQIETRAGELGVFDHPFTGDLFIAIVVVAIAVHPESATE